MQFALCKHNEPFLTLVAYKDHTGGSRIRETNIAVNRMQYIEIDTWLLVHRAGSLEALAPNSFVVLDCLAVTPRKHNIQEHHVRLKI